MVELHAKVAGEAAEALLKKSRVPEKLATARAAVTKEAIRRERLAAMDAALKAGSTQGVYAARDALVAAYPEQANQRDLVAKMTAANELVKKAVKVDMTGRPAQTEPRTEPLGPASSLVLRQPPLAKPVANGPLVYALADGMAVALDGATGTPVWQVPVGLASPFAPLAIPGGTALLVVDARHHELVRLDARTGRFVWRQELGGRVTDAPLVLGNQIIQATPSGKLLFIDLTSGALRATLNAGVPLSRSPVSDESGQALYIAGERDVLFVLKLDPLGCEEVEYLGHAPGAIGAPPARIGRYLIVPDNAQLNESRWRVFMLSEDGLKAKAVQDVPIQGWTWSAPVASGSVVWALGDRGGVSALAVGAYGEPDPLRPLARIAPEAESSGPAFPIARSERELWVASGRSGRYLLDPAAAKLTASWTLAGAGPAIGPPQVAGPLLVLTQQNIDGPGVGLWGVDPANGAVRWRTILGAPWPSPPIADGKSDQLSALGVDGLPIELPHDLLARGGFVTATIPALGEFRLPPGALARLEGDGWTAVVPALGAATMLVRAGMGSFRQVTLPAPLGAAPLAWGKELLVPGDDGRVYLIDPITSEPRGAVRAAVRPHQAGTLADAGGRRRRCGDLGGRSRPDSSIDPRPRPAPASGRLGGSGSW